MEPKKIGYYASALRGSVPKKAKKEATYKLGFMSVYLILALVLVYSIGMTNSYFWIIVMSCITGIFFASLFTYCHELSHGTIIRNRKKLYPFEILFWSVNYMPPTVWQIVHNHTHHHTANTYNDPDRRTYKSEANKTNFIYNLFIYPNKTIRYSFTVGFAMILYTWKHTAAVFYSKETKPKIVTFKPDYSKEDQRQVAFELVFIILFQVLLFLLIGSIWKYLLFISVAYFISSSIIISLVITQHLINPNFIDVSDPVLSSTSIQLPKFLDFLVDYHSYHTEHHIFPGINFDYYPYVSKELKEKFPERYNSLPFVEAIKRAYDEDVFIDDPLT